MYRMGRKEDAGDDEDGVQGIAGEIGLGLMIQLARVSYACESNPLILLRSQYGMRRCLRLFPFWFEQGVLFIDAYVGRFFSTQG